MSTVSQAPAKPAARYEGYVEEQLARARNRIRLLDLAVAGLALLGATLAYTFGVTLGDRLFELPPLARQAAFGLFLLAAVGFVGLTVSRVFLRRVNPYYAAQQVEHGLPGAKNSVVNWLDLHDKELPPAIKGAVSQRAARELARADLDQILRTRQANRLGALTGAVFLALLVFFFLSPPQFFSLLRRAFAPFREGAIATRTQLALVQPENGDLTVAVGRAVPFAARVDGRVPAPGQPDASRLLYRYQENAPFVERPLERGNSAHEWDTVLPASEVRNGFWYKLRAGDAETPEYRVQVRSTPLLSDFKVTYRFRPYLHRPDLTTNEPNLEALRGTEVTLEARANRVVKEGQLIFEERPENAGEKPAAKRTVVAERVGNDSRAMHFRLPLDKGGTYRIWFVSAEDERNTDPVPYTVHVLTDQAPRVDLTRPGKPLSLPANGTLVLEGAAHDDYGLTGLTLKMQVEGREESRPYRPGKSFRFDNGTYPLKLDYRDAVELDKLRQENGQPLRPGMKIEYWLEAADNCDYPGPNVGASSRYTLTIAEPDKDPPKKDQQQQQRQQAKQEQREHEEKQDRQLDQENQQKQPGSSDKSEDARAGDPGKPDGNAPQDGGGANPDDQKLERDAERLRQAIEGERNGDGAEEKSDAKNSENTDQAGKRDPSMGAGTDNPKGDAGEGGKPNPDKGQGADGPKGDGSKANSDANKGEGGKDSKGDGQGKPDRGKGQGADDPKGGGNHTDADPGKGQSGNPDPSKGQGGNDQKGDKSEGGNPDPSKGQGGGEPKGDDGKGKPDPKKGQGGGDRNGNAGKDKSEPSKGQGGNPDPSKGQGGDDAKGDQAKGKPDPSKGQGDGNPKGEQGKGKPDPGKGEGRDDRKGDAGAQGKPDSTKGQGGDDPKGDKGNGKPDPSNGEGKDNPKGEPGNDGKPDSSKGEGGNDPNGGTGQGRNPDPGKNREGKRDPAKGQGSDQPNSDGGKEKADPNNGQGEKPDPSKGQGGNDSKGDKGNGKPDPSKGEGNDNPKGNSGNAGKPDPSKGEGGDDPKGGTGQGRDSDPGRKRDGKGDPSKGQGGDDSKNDGGKEKADPNNGQGGKPDPSKGQGGDDRKGDEKKKPGGADSKPDGGGNADRKGDRGKRQENNPKGDTGDPEADPNRAPGGKPDASKGQAGDHPPGEAGKDKRPDAGKGAGGEDLKPDKGKGDSNAPQPGDLEQLLKALKNGDAQVRGDAARKLEDAKNQVNDPALRKAIEDALRECQGGAGGQGKSPSDQQGKGAKDKPAGGEPDNQGEGQGDGPGKPNSTPGGAAGRGSTASRETPAVDSPDPNPPETPADPRNEKKAGELQIDDIKKKVNKDVLKKANMTEEEFQEFLKAYSAMLKRRQAAAGDEDKLTDPKARGGNLRNIGGKQAKPTGKDDKTQKGGIALPPSEFREPYKEFSEKISGLKRNPESK
jgi:hypothetical protein